MFVSQVSIFVENKSGSIADVISILGENGINLRALSVADTADYGILRLICEEPERALGLLKGHNYTARITNVLGFTIPDEPNSLGKVLKIVNDHKIDITYIYTFIGHYYGKAVAIIKTTDLESTQKVLEQNNITIIDGSEIYKN
jgi:hypothetical protein